MSDNLTCYIMIREGGTRMEGRRLIGFEIRSLNNLIMRNI